MYFQMPNHTNHRIDLQDFMKTFKNSPRERKTRVASLSLIFVLSFDFEIVNAKRFNYFDL